MTKRTARDASNSIRAGFLERERLDLRLSRQFDRDMVVLVRAFLKRAPAKYDSFCFAMGGAAFYHPCGTPLGYSDSQHLRLNHDAKRIIETCEDIVGIVGTLTFKMDKKGTVTRDW